MWVKIPNEDFTDVTVAIGDTYGVMKLEVMMGVLDMNFDKVANEVTDMEIDKKTEMVVNITNEEFIGVIWVIGGQIYN